MRKFLHFFGWHHYKFDHESGVNMYYECSICGKRIFRSPCGGYSPVDFDWLMKINYEYKTVKSPELTMLDVCQVENITIN